MPRYLATITAKIEIEATNAKAAKDAFGQDRLCSIKVIGASSASLAAFAFVASISIVAVRVAKRSQA